MQPHEQRIIKEKKELDIKAKALHAFIQENEAYKSLHYLEKSLLTRQYVAMKEYSDILGERIAAFKTRPK